MSNHTDQLFRAAVQHHQAGRLGDAEQLYRQVLNRHPKHADALHLLGVIAYQVGQNHAAIQLIRQAITFQPRHPEAHNNLGNALRASGQLDEAIVAYRQTIALKPDHAAAYSNMGAALEENGCLDQAIAAYQSAITLKPDFAAALNNMGNALRGKGRLDEALVAYRQALALQPNYTEIHNNLGNTLRDKGRMDEAIAFYRQAIAIKPDFPAAHTNLGNALKDKGRMDEAIAAHLQAIELKPDFAEAHNNLGNALQNKGQLDDAVTRFQQAIALKSDFADAHNNLGSVMKDMGLMDEALAAYRHAIALKPDYSEAHSNLVYSLHFHPDFHTLAIAGEHRLWNRRFAESLKQLILPHANNRDPERRLRIGYVSPDFYAQAESFFVLPLLAAHDLGQFEIHAYASVKRPDRVTDRMRRSVSVWHDVLGMTNEELAGKIRRDGIDILVDLTMHMADNRLPLFARKPAPVQVTWLAYPGSTGLETIDYRITDAWMDPSSLGTDGYSEESIRLPDSWCCYDPMSDLPPVPCETAHHGDFVRFGSFNNFCKLNEPLLAVWAQLLAALPGSRLLLLAPEGSARERTWDRFGREGIDRGRIEFVGKCSRDEYLRLYDRIDIALDPLPYNGITTTLDALWMGVPVVSLAGKTAAGRVGLSLLSTVGLPELATKTPDEFVRITSDLAKDLPRLSGLRSLLRERMRTSPLMDAPRFARNMETAYREMWRRWCEQPESQPCPK
jgi:predicted O-linked N-acetylglucosamine transferase (SPINDLY family)